MDQKQPRINRPLYFIIGVAFLLDFIYVLATFSGTSIVSWVNLFVSALVMFYCFLSLLQDIHYIGFPKNNS